jgi:hypothetical protein
MMDGRIIFLGLGCALPRDCCSGVSVSAGGCSYSAVIDSRYKPARQRAIRVHSGYSWFKDIRTRWAQVVA